jgi:hypothetical protein
MLNVSKDICNTRILEWKTFLKRKTRQRIKTGIKYEYDQTDDKKVDQYTTHTK